MLKWENRKLEIRFKLLSCKWRIQSKLNIKRTFIKKDNQ